MSRHVIAPVSELPPGSRKFVTIDDRPIAIFNIKGEFFGLLNRCPHQGASLCEGTVVHRGRTIATAEARLTAEATGRLLAHGTATCLLMGGGPPAHQT